MDGLLGFYLQAVLPTALAQVRPETRQLQPHVQSIQQIFNGLKGDVNACVSLTHWTGAGAWEGGGGAGGGGVTQRVSTLTLVLHIDGNGSHPTHCDCKPAGMFVTGHLVSGS